MVCRYCEGVLKDRTGEGYEDEGGFDAVKERWGAFVSVMREGHGVPEAGQEQWPSEGLLGTLAVGWIDE